MEREPVAELRQREHQQYAMFATQPESRGMAPGYTDRAVKFSARPERAMSYQPRVKPWETGRQEGLRSEGAPH